MPGAATIASGAATAAVLGAFEYNRGNFRFDAGLRFDRFIAGRDFGIEQADQYREDIRQLSELTTMKTNTYNMVATLLLAVNLAVFTAGRLGLHGPSPPGWMSGLMLTSIASSMSCLCLCIWFNMHAQMRAASAAVHLLTRSVRLPVPTRKQMDQARFLSTSFERQKWRDILRVPFVTGHPAEVPDVGVDDSASRIRSRPRSEPPVRRTKNAIIDDHSCPLTHVTKKGANLDPRRMGH